MKKSLLIVLVLLVLLVFWFFEGRRFYCVGDNQCITVWKYPGGNCYVVPGKYWSLLKPKENYMITSNISNFVAIWPENGRNIIISTSPYSKFYNNKPSLPALINYDSRKDFFDSLYTIQKGDFHVFKRGLKFISVDLGWLIVKDNNNKKL